VLKKKPESSPRFQNSKIPNLSDDEIRALGGFDQSRRRGASRSSQSSKPELDLSESSCRHASVPILQMRSLSPVPGFRCPKLD
jgi:hypothetical protein